MSSTRHILRIAVNCRSEREEFISQIKRIKRSSFRDWPEMVGILRMLYESIYGIYDHRGDQTGPDAKAMALNFAKEAEDTSYLIRREILVYTENNINKSFGMSYLEFSNLPTEYREVIVEIAAKINQVQNKLNAELESKIGNLGN